MHGQCSARVVLQAYDRLDFRITYLCPTVVRKHAHTCGRERPNSESMCSVQRAALRRVTAAAKAQGSVPLTNGVTVTAGSRRGTRCVWYDTPRGRRL